MKLREAIQEARKVVEQVIQQPGQSTITFRPVDYMSRDDYFRHCPRLPGGQEKVTRPVDPMSSTPKRIFVSDESGRTVVEYREFDLKNLIPADCGLVLRRHPDAHLGAVED